MNLFHYSAGDQFFFFFFFAERNRYFHCFQKVIENQRLINTLSKDSKKK